MLLRSSLRSDIDDEVRELSAEVRRQIVTTRLEQTEVRFELSRERLHHLQIRRAVLANGTVRASSSLHGADALRRRERRVSHEEFAVFLREDVVSHHDETVLIAQQTAQRKSQSGLA